MDGDIFHVSSFPEALKVAQQLIRLHQHTVGSHPDAQVTAQEIMAREMDRRAREGAAPLRSEHEATGREGINTEELHRAVAQVVLDRASDREFVADGTSRGWSPPRHGLDPVEAAALAAWESAARRSESKPRRSRSRHRSSSARHKDVHQIELENLQLKRRVQELEARSEGLEQQLSTMSGKGPIPSARQSAPHPLPATQRSLTAGIPSPPPPARLQTRGEERKPVTIAEAREAVKAATNRLRMSVQRPIHPSPRGALETPAVETARNPSQSLADRQMQIRDTTAAAAVYPGPSKDTSLSKGVEDIMLQHSAAPNREDIPAPTPAPAYPFTAKPAAPTTTPAPPPDALESTLQMHERRDDLEKYLLKAGGPLDESTTQSESGPDAKGGDRKSPRMNTADLDKAIADLLRPNSVPVPQHRGTTLSPLPAPQELPTPTPAPPLPATLGEQTQTARDEVHDTFWQEYSKALGRVVYPPPAPSPPMHPATASPKGLSAPAFQSVTCSPSRLEKPEVAAARREKAALLSGILSPPVRRC